MKIDISKLAELTELLKAGDKVELSGWIYTGQIGRAHV